MVMKTPRDKYQNDPAYKMLVDTLVSQIVECKYTPSELREAALLASIIYEEMTIRPLFINFPKEINNGMEEGDRIRVFKYAMGYRTGTKDVVVEKFRHCLGFFASENDRTAGNFTPLFNIYEKGPDSVEKYIPNYGAYHTNMVRGWMDLP